MMIDLHCHTKQRSVCSSADEEDIIQQAIDDGLGGIAFSDHNRLIPPKRLKELNEKYKPFRLFNGIEMTVRTSSDFCHFLVIGLYDKVMESGSWKYVKLLKWVRKMGGWIAWAHPFRYVAELPREILLYPPDAMELCSTNITSGARTTIIEAAEKMRCRLIGASDAHVVGDVGYRAIELNMRAHTDAELVTILKNGAFTIKERSY